MKKEELIKRISDLESRNLYLENNDKNIRLELSRALSIENTNRDFYFSIAKTKIESTWESILIEIGKLLKLDDRAKYDSRISELMTTNQILEKKLLKYETHA